MTDEYLAAELAKLGEALETHKDGRTPTGASLTVHKLAGGGVYLEFSVTLQPGEVKEEPEEEEPAEEDVEPWKHEDATVEE